MLWGQGTTSSPASRFAHDLDTLVFVLVVGVNDFLVRTFFFLLPVFFLKPISLESGGTSSPGEGEGLPRPRDGVRSRAERGCGGGEMERNHDGPPSVETGDGSVRWRYCYWALEWQEAS